MTLHTTEDDARLTLDALAKVVAAQRRGTLSARMYINRLPSQIVLDNTTPSDRRWIERHFPGAVEEASGHGVTKRTSTSRVEQVHYVAPLRKESDRDAMLRRMVPRLEVWHIDVPHVCRHFVGHASEKGVVWKCRAYNCGKRITKTKARELGLLP